jgi:hypothetical protein
MRVKFTNTITKKVEFGSMIEIFDPQHVVVQADRGGRYIINPNSDYNIGFIPNEEADRKYAAALDRKVDELDALDKKSEKSC